MIFYRAVDGDNLVHWLTVQGEAKSIDKDFTEQSIGNAKSDIKQLLNDCEARLHFLQGKINSLEFDANIAPVTILPPLPEALHFTGSGVTDWLLSTATQAEVENMFSAIGCRWGETRKNTE